MDYGALLYGPTYTVLGVAANLTIAGAGYAITAIDKTAGISLGDTVEIETITPAATVQAADLVALGLTADQLVGGVLTINGGDWLIISYRSRPSPAGAGEYLLLLEAA